MTPSVKSLLRIPGLDRATAKEIKQWLQYANGESAHEAQTACGNYVIQHSHPEPRPELIQHLNTLYCRPTRREKAHAAIALILTEGRDASWEVCQDQSEWPYIASGPAWEAVGVLGDHAGDAYITTLCRVNGRYRVSAWGNLSVVNR